MRQTLMFRVSLKHLILPTKLALPHFTLLMILTSDVVQAEPSETCETLLLIQDSNKMYIYPLFILLSV